ncbi:MAG: hypothetical protein WBC91_20540 [Phototrophicaceae bacterium]
MVWLNNISEDQRLLIKFWLPALINGLLIWALLILLGDTPLIRASGLALIIVGVTLALRRMGAALAVIGSLSLALSPVFWSQTGGAEGTPATIVIALFCAGLTIAIAALISKRPYIGFGLGVIVFVALFWSQIGTPRSIRLTGFVVAWLMYLLIDMLLVTNPRPEDAPLILRDGNLTLVNGAIAARPYHIYGILLLITVGIINDPLLTILLPCIILSLLFTRTKLHTLYWVCLIGIAIFGIRGIWLDYVIAQSHLLTLGGWRQGINWLDMIKLIINQFTIAGALLSALGLARLARWYASLGIISMVGFAAYWLFGTIYIGSNESLLLLPMYIIFILWITYAVFAISEWSAKTFITQPVIGRYLVIAVYCILPITLLLRIV